MDVQFSGAEVAVIVALLAAVTTPLGVVFRMLITAKDAHAARQDHYIARLEAKNDELMQALLAGTKSVENATTVLKRTTQR